MLYLVLLLVVASLGLLIAALTTANTVWAWISVTLSVIAAGLLVMDWVRNRRRSRAAPAAGKGPGLYGSARPAESDPEPELSSDVRLPPLAAVAFDPVLPEPAVSDFAVSDFASSQRPALQDPSVEPAEENTDAADILVVSELADEVVVIDERPRYHLSACAWLGDRPVVPLPVSEARELGFTPCMRCSPDATLAAKHRSLRSGRLSPWPRPAS
jgi:hypothetical protein